MWACHIMENEWQWFLPILKFECSEWKFEFWKTWIHPYEFHSFSILKDISNETGSDIYKCDFLIL